MRAAPPLRLRLVGKRRISIASGRTPKAGVAFLHEGRPFWQDENSERGKVAENLRRVSPRDESMYPLACDARMSNDLFCGDLVRKYGGSPGGMPIWVLMELFSFGSFIDLCLFCAERWNDDEMMHEHYMLRQAKSVRNACAHSSDILNGIAVIDTRVGADATVMNALAEAGLSHRVRTTKMKNPRIRQIATLMHLHTQLVPAGSGKKNAASNLASLEKRLLEMGDLAPTNDAIRSTVAFLAKLIDSWFR